MNFRIAFCLGLSIANCLGANYAGRFFSSAPSVMRATAQQALSFEEFDRLFKSGLFVPGDALRVPVESLPSCESFGISDFSERETVSTSLFCRIMTGDVRGYIQDLVDWRNIQSKARIYDRFNYIAFTGFGASSNHILEQLAKNDNYPVAQFLLGQEYERLYGFDEAFAYYDAAKKQGHAAAKARLVKAFGK